MTQEEIIAKIRGLTRAHRRALRQIGRGTCSPSCKPEILAELIGAGLVIKRTYTKYSITTGPYLAHEYLMPVTIYIAWHTAIYRETVA